MSYYCVKCPRYFLTKKSLHNHAIGFHKYGTLFATDEERENDEKREQNGSDDQQESNDTSSETNETEMSMSNTSNQRRKHKRIRSNDKESEDENSDESEAKNSQKHRRSNSESDSDESVAETEDSEESEVEISKKRLKKNKRDSDSDTDQSDGSDASGSESEESDDAEVSTRYRLSPKTFYCKPLTENHYDGLETILQNERTFIPEFVKLLELEDKANEFMVGSDVIEMMQTLVSAAKNGEITLTRKLLIDILRNAKKFQIPENPDFIATTQPFKYLNFV
jgi:hypothetical protein